jgi:hypothetical protein
MTAAAFLVLDILPAALGAQNRRFAAAVGTNSVNFAAAAAAVVGPQPRSRRVLVEVEEAGPDVGEDTSGAASCHMSPDCTLPSPAVVAGSMGSMCKSALVLSQSIDCVLAARRNMADDLGKHVSAALHTLYPSYL